MHMITLETARKIADAAMADAQKRNIAKWSVVVTDQGGNIRIAMRADASGNFGVDIARGKALSALGFNLSSLKLAQNFGASPSFTAAINAATGGGFVPLGGGVVVVNAAAVIIGAAAFAGAMPEVDDEIITAAVRSAGLAVPA